MLNFFQEKRQRYLKWAGATVLACFVCFFLVWGFLQMSKIKKPPPQSSQPKKNLTPQDIQKILNKKKIPENQKKPLNQEDIQKMLNEENKKTPENQKKPLNQEDIQKMLNESAK